jgi:diaminohydroxyphosphoribosylaminopyrimidine deaminase/5-amino-6-(5-phosphoribosylamino)uracil reductase
MHDTPPRAPCSVDALWPQLLAVVHTASTGTGASAAGTASHAVPHTDPNSAPNSTPNSAPICVPVSAPISALQRHSTLGWQLAGEADSGCDEPARDLFELFKPLLDGARPGPGGGTRPWVLAQLGQSLDGCIATRSGESAFVSGPECLQHLHRLRALSDVVIVGAGTVAADNPRLTTRLVPGPNPVRVLLDPALGLAEHVHRAHVFTDSSVPTLWLCDSRWAARAQSLVGTERVLAVPGLRRDDGTPALAAACTALAERGFKRLFVEGGGVTVSRFLSQRLLDRLHLGVAPVLIGDGRRGLHFAGAPRLADCARPRCRVYPMGVDRLWDLDLRDGGTAGH